MPPPNNNAGVPLPPDCQVPATLSDVTNAFHYRDRLQKSQKSGAANRATDDEIGASIVYEAGLALSYAPQGPAAPAWLNALGTRIDELVDSVNELKDSMKLENALSENSRRILRNIRVGPGGEYVPLKKWKSGHGADLARVIFGHVANPADVASIGDLPTIACGRPTDLSNANLLQLVVFYNDNFGIVPTDDITFRRDKFSQFLSNVDFF